VNKPAKNKIGGGFVMDTTSELTGFVCKTQFRDLPEDVVKKAKKLILDTLGSIIYSSGLVWSKKVASLMQDLKSQGKATIIAFGTKTSPPAAALANGTMGHGFELDDVHEGAMLHPGAVVIPAALSVGEQESVDGRKFLLAVAMGYEVMCRIGIGVGAKYHMVKGFHPTGTNGPFGAAAAAGKIMGLKEDKIIDALGIAGSTCSSIMQFTQDPSGGGDMIKRFHAGWASQSGVVAALLAKRGFRGPSDIIGGKFGYCNVYSDHPQIDLTNQGLGNIYEIMNVGTKPYACCTTMHAIVDGIAKLKTEYGLKGDEIEEIKVGGSKKLVAFSGIYEIQSAMAAQYSAPFCVALTLMGDIKNPKNFKKVSDDSKGKDLKRIMMKTKLFVDDDLEKVSPAIEGAKIIMTLKNGKSLKTQVMHSKGNPKNEMSFEEICEKFVILTQGKIAAKKRDQIITSIQSLESLPSISRLTNLLVKH
jgi:2-methylcitrate dehydratase PrpD